MYHFESGRKLSTCVWYIGFCKEKSCKHSGRLGETSRRSGRFAGVVRISFYAAVAHRLRASVIPDHGRSEVRILPAATIE